MSIAPSPPARPFVAEDLDSMPDDGYRREIIGGALVVTPSPVGRHQRCVFELAVLLRAAAPDHLEVVLSPFDWRPLTGESFQPDIMVIRREDFDPDGPPRNTPILVVEVLSASNPAQDQAVKRFRYQALGVPNYWIVNPLNPEIVALTLAVGGRYRQVARVAGRQVFSADNPYPVDVVPAALVER